MPHRVISNDADVADMAAFLTAAKKPLTVSWVQGRDRSGEQNRLLWKWASEIADQRPDLGTAQDIHAYNKLHFGVAIRKEEDDFADKYDRVIRPLPYEAKLEIMSPPIDFPITRDMRVKQMTRFLDAVWHHWSAQGIKLTEPSE